jgi:integrase
MGRDGRGVKVGSESSIEITFMYNGVRCRERISLKPTAANLKRAEQHRAAVLYAISTGTFDYAETFPNSTIAKRFSKPVEKPKLVEEFLDKWLADHKQRLKASTYAGYRKVVMGHLIPLFGSMPLPDLTKKAVRDKLRMMQITNKTLANIQSVLRKALSDAVDEYELIESNPLAGWTFKNKDAIPSDEVIDPFTADEQVTILTSLEGQARNLVQFALWTGMRTSELVALDWTDVDFLRGTVRVSRAQTQASGQAEVPKTSAGRRDVKLLQHALEALNAQKQQTWLKGAEVFQNPRTGERWTGDQPIRKTMWTPALKRAGVRYRNPYQTRHTYASMMLSSGEHPMWVASQMGHADWTMIARVYGRWMPEADPSAGDKAQEKFGNDSGMTTYRRKPA